MVEMYLNSTTGAIGRRFCLKYSDISTRWKSRCKS
jgi:hypothetical protein